MKDPLLARLEAFSIDPTDVALPFTRRLAQENAWSRAFAERVVAEYRRFVWLAMRAGHSVTPSLAVDEAWHLHLCYTRSYWNDLCANVLGRPLHHGPTQGGAAEDDRYWQQYEATLASYRRHFGEEPPADIWPPPEERFARTRVAKVDRRTHWVVKKPGPRLLAAGSFGVVLIALSACAGELDDRGPSFLVGVLVLLALIVVVFLVGMQRKKETEERDSGCGGSPSHGGGGGCGTVAHHGHGSGHHGGRHAPTDHDGPGHDGHDGHGGDGNGDGGGGGGEGAGDGGGGGCGSSGCGSSGCGGGGD